MRSNNLRIRAAMLTLLLVVSGIGALSADESEVVDRWMQLYHQSAMSVEMRLTDEPDDSLTLIPTPLLRYTNPVRRVQQHGAVYVWTIEERPAVIAAFWSALPEPGMRRLNFEWHSLHDAPLSAEYNGERLWETREPGLEWHLLADVPPPASLPLPRLVQMRRIASSFDVEIHTDESELRFMPQPVLRYPEDPEGAAGVVDGAIFTFVMGTDPELFLLVEARAEENGEKQWYVGFVRFTNAPLTVSREGRQWWSCPRFPVRLGTPVRTTDSYYLHLEVQRLPAELDAGGEAQRQ